MGCEQSKWCILVCTKWRWFVRVELWKRDAEVNMQEQYNSLWQWGAKLIVTTQVTRLLRDWHSFRDQYVLESSAAGDSRSGSSPIERGGHGSDMILFVWRRISFPEMTGCARSHIRLILHLLTDTLNGSPFYLRRNNTAYEMCQWGWYLQGSSPPYEYKYWWDQRRIGHVPNIYY